METPAALGYRMPAEWEPHRATWLSWPHRQPTWQGNFAPIPAVWATLAKLLSQSEQVEILAGEPVWDQAHALVGNLPNIRLHNISTNDAWMRDHGPTFLVGENLPPALIDWDFNAWGKKYPRWDLDDAVPQTLAKLLDKRRFAPGIVLEGGSIDVNGCGTVLTTERCLLNQNRNPHLSREELERYLADYLQAPNVLWLGDGIAGDDTDGHVDDLTRFVNATTVVTAFEEDPQSVNYQPLYDNWKRLQTLRDQAGRPLEVVKLPMPKASQHVNPALPASYANFYIANTLVVVPVFNEPADEIAIGILQKFFPTRRVVGLYAWDLVWGSGACHCITQQEPLLN